MINSGEQGHPKRSCVWEGSKNTLTGRQDPFVVAIVAKIERLVALSKLREC